MKKKLFALSGVFLIVLVITGLWATKATDLMGVISGPQTGDPLAATSLATGPSLQEMATESNFIGIVECLGTTSQRRGRNVVTLAEVSVLETIKGDVPAGTSLTVATLGGTDTTGKFPIAVTVPGAPQFYTGDKDFLFLAAEGEFPGSYTVMGLSQGKFSVVNDDVDQPFVTRDPTRRMHKGVGNIQAIPLQDFIHMVRGYLKQ